MTAEQTKLIGELAPLYPRTGMRALILPAIFVGALLTSAWAWWLIAWPVVALEASPRHAGHFGFVYAHMVGGTIMLVLGAAALYVGWTRQQFRYHKLLGYTYLSAGVLGAGLALVLALAGRHRPAGPLSWNLGEASNEGFALATLSTAWFVVSAMAYRAARNRRFEAHRGWMIRSYVLTWSFVLCRVLGRVPVLASLGDGAAIVWLSWIVPLLVCEVALQWADTAPRSAPPATARPTVPAA